MNKLTVIYYHEIVPAGYGNSYQKVEKQKFEEQMAYLRDEGYTSLVLNELGKPIPEKAVLVAFDDGFESVYSVAAPIMEKYGIKGNVFLATKYIDADEHFMKWENIKELYSSKKFDFGAHTHSHIDIRTQAKTEMEYEIRESNQIIESNLGFYPTSFCMPYGKFNFVSVRLLDALGCYKFLFASFYGQTKLKTKIIPRIGISNSDSLETFKRKMNGKKNWKGLLQLIRLSFCNLKRERIYKYEY